MTRNTVDNAQDILDSRDVQEYLDELEDDDDRDEEEYKALKEFVKEARDYCEDWEHGETLIRESHFTEYAQDLADDIGAISRDLKWPYTCIDWERAAKELKYDYTSADFDGVTYYFR